MKEIVAYRVAMEMLRHHAAAAGLSAEGGDPAHRQRASNHTLRGFVRHGLC